MQRYRIGVTYLLLVAASLFFVPAAAASEQPDIFRNARWRSAKISIAVSTSLSKENSNIRGDAGAAIRNSIVAWTGTADIAIAVSSSELQSVSPKGVRGDGVSLLTSASTAENLRLFPSQAESPAATTRVFLNPKGEISEADIVLNPFVQFSTDGTFGTYDLQDTLTHEIGHLLGLEHSTLWGSIMYELGSRNSEMIAGSRSELPKTDAAAIKSIYGPLLEDIECCGSVYGRVSGVKGNRNHKTLVWLEEADTGRVAAAVVAEGDGSFRIGGVSEGRYRIFVSSEAGENLAATDSSEVSVATADDIRIDLTAKYKESPFRTRFLGSSPQLAQLPIRINLDRSSRIYLGGSGFDSGNARMRFSTERIVAGAELSRLPDIGDPIKVIGFDLSVTGNLPRGEYTLITEDQNGVQRFLVGAIISAGN
jgi:hypothetical protein